MPLAQQNDLFETIEQPTYENPDYLKKQIITYIGNKRALIPFIFQAVNLLRSELKQEKISFLDLFAGSGVVSRYARRYAHTIYCNDLEPYSYIINRCYQTNKHDVDWVRLTLASQNLSDMIKNKPYQGFISELYAPEDNENVKKGERVFYTRENAILLDSFCHYLPSIPEKLRIFLLAPIIYQASNNANTGGVFKGFYKKNGIGHFGGTGEDALKRIKRQIRIMLPILSNITCKSYIFNEDANHVVHKLPGVDIAYFDPPYNQHPYGSNYFMLNLLCNYKKPEKISRVSGIPDNWNRSLYNKKVHASNALFAAIENVNAKFVLISYNEDGFIKKKEFLENLGKIGAVKVMDKKYNTFRGSRNFTNRDIHVIENLYLLDKR